MVNEIRMNILDIQPTDLADLIREIELWVMETKSDTIDLDTVHYVHDFLQELNRMLSAKSATAAEITQLRELCIFPVSDESAAALLRLAASNDFFWIGDIPMLQKVFHGKLPLLVRPDKYAVKNLEKIFHVLGMDGKRLTMTVSCEFTSQESGGEFDREFTGFLKRKIPYMTGILTNVEEPKPNLKILVSQLRNLRVQRVSGIKIRRFVVRDKTRIYGEDEEGEICLQPHSKGLIINMDPGLEAPDIFGLLEEHLSNYWDLQSKSRELLFKILASSSEKRYTEAFERAGILLKKANRRESKAATVEPEGDNKGRKTKLASETVLELPFSRPDDSDEERFPQIISQQVRQHPVDTNPIYSGKNSYQTNTENSPTYRRRGKLTEAAPISPPTQENSAATRVIIQRMLNTSASDMTKSQYQIFRNTTETKRAQPRRRALDDDIMLDAPVPSSAQMSIDLTSNDAQQRKVTRARPQASVDRVITTPSPEKFTGLAANVQRRIFSDDSSRKPILSQSVNHEIHSPSSARKKRKYNADEEYGTHSEGITHEIGRAGEYLVFNFLSRTLGASFKSLHWTSRNRNHFFPATSFTEFEGDFADFTYKDEEGILGEYLTATVPDYQPPLSLKTTYHLEVKCTLEGLDADAILSNNQVQLAKGFSKWGKQADTTQEDVYVLVRVYDLEKDDRLSPKLCFFPDPWDLICRGRLLIEGENGIYVRPVQTCMTK